MTMGYSFQAEREQALWEAKARLDAALAPFNKAAPRSLMDENVDLYRKRTLPLLQAHAPGFQDIKAEDARGSSFDHLERQIYEAAANEARFPTQVPEGELKQVTRYDAAGRPFYEWYGSPSAWMSQLTRPKKRLIGICTETQTGYRPGNM
jgi:hypothetical protein